MRLLDVHQHAPAMFAVSGSGDLAIHGSGASSSRENCDIWQRSTGPVRAAHCTVPAKCGAAHLLLLFLLVEPQPTA